MENYPVDRSREETDASESFLVASDATQASNDRFEMIQLARVELAASKGIDVIELTTEDLAKTIQQIPLQTDMAMDEIFGAGFTDFMNDTEEYF